MEEMKKLLEMLTNIATIKLFTTGTKCNCASEQCRCMLDHACVSVRLCVNIHLIP